MHDGRGRDWRKKINNFHSLNRRRELIEMNECVCVKMRREEIWPDVLTLEEKHFELATPCPPLVFLLI